MMSVVWCKEGSVNFDEYDIMMLWWTKWWVSDVNMMWWHVLEDRCGMMKDEYGVMMTGEL